MESGNLLLQHSKLGNLDDVKALLEDQKTNVNYTDKDGKTGLICASENNQVEIVQVLLKDPNIDVNLATHRYSWTALIYASVRNYADIFALLLKHPNINVNHADIYNRTAIMYACSNGYTNIV